MFWQKKESGVGPLGRRRLAPGEAGKREKAKGELVWSLGQSTGAATRLEKAAKELPMELISRGS